MDQDTAQRIYDLLERPVDQEGQEWTAEDVAQYFGMDYRDDLTPEELADLLQDFLDAG